MTLSFFGLFFLCLSPAFAAVGPEATLEITNQIIAPDGFQRSAIVVDGTTPGPLIAAMKGDSFRLNVVNDLFNDTMLRSTSVHWHGLLQQQSPWEDGPVGVNQCPISPGHSFLYEFTNKERAGTFWYHSHFGTQYCDGLRGPLVIYDPDDPHRELYDVDDETTVITLADWYHTPSPSLKPKVPAVSDSTLINGKGRYPGGPPVGLSIVNVQAGKQYRFRLVSISCDPNFTFSIDGHDLTIIEADAENTVPHTVNTIQIFAGQRYSFILKANQEIDNYWIRALPNPTTNQSIISSSGFAGGINSAILHYIGAPRTEPTSYQQEVANPLFEADLQALTDARAPGEAVEGGVDVSINLVFGIGSKGFTVNGKPFHDPDVPLLLQLLHGAKTAQELLPNGSVYVLPRNKVIEISMPGGVIGGPHPFHLHGHPFSVVRSAGESSFNFFNPVRRDVVNIGSNGSNVTIRFITDNPGPWLLHCHIDFHYANGLAVVFAEDTDTMSNASLQNYAPDSWKELCPTYNALPSSQTSVRFVNRDVDHTRQTLASGKRRLSSPHETEHGTSDQV